MPRLLFLAVLCAFAYAPALSIPLIEDDYPNITQAQDYGPLSGLDDLLADRLFRLRATSYWVMYGLWSAAGVEPLPYHLLSLLLHVANTWLVYGLALLWPPFRQAALWAAAFFAIHEGHQEAVMWFSAINELLMFFFGIGALACWSMAQRRRRWQWHIAGVTAFSLALLSKESAVIVLPLFLLVTPRERWRSEWLPLIPYAVAVALAVASVLSGWGSTFRFADGSFSLSAPFWITWPRSLARLLWIWGFVAIVLLWLRTRWSEWRAVAVTLAWMAASLVPYSFLLYMTRVPSRQTYLASAGLALVCGLAIAKVAEWSPRRMLPVLLAAMLLHNTAILWRRKKQQFEERAAPTEQLIAFARLHRDATILVRCFPRQRLVAEEAVRLSIPAPAPRIVWSREDAGDDDRRPVIDFCYQPPP